ncbi:MAG: TolB family protein [Anaerolineaceae bacterium]|nr:TolB family protein [Anaerolineaceae bacterium]
MKKKYRILLLFILFIRQVACDSPVSTNQTAIQIPIDLDGSLQNPAWSPDEKTILLTRFQNGYNKGPADLILYDIERQNVTILVSDGSENVNLPGSAWNQKKDMIVFSSSRDPHDEIYLINPLAQPGRETRITNRESLVAYEPSFSPDGEWIVFESHEMDIAEAGKIFKFKTDGSGKYIQLTDSSLDSRQPNWSPDGKLIVYQTYIDNIWELWIMNADGTNQHQLTHGPGDKTDASFSPDSKWIVFSADDPEIKYAELFIQSIYDTKSRQITTSGGYAGAPSWSPDGKTILFEAATSNPENSTDTTIWIMDAPIVD